MATMLNKDGQLSLYALGCGYIQEHGDFLHGTCTRLWNEGGPCWHIRTTFNDPGKRVWDIAESLTEARRKFKAHIREYHT